MTKFVKLVRFFCLLIIGLAGAQNAMAECFLMHQPSAEQAGKVTLAFDGCTLAEINALQNALPASTRSRIANGIANIKTVRPNTQTEVVCDAKTKRCRPCQDDRKECRQELPLDMTIIPAADGLVGPASKLRLAGDGQGDDRYSIRITIVGGDGQDSQEPSTNGRSYSVKGRASPGQATGRNLRIAWDVAVNGGSQLDLAAQASLAEIRRRHLAEFTGAIAKMREAAARAAGERNQAIEARIELANRQIATSLLGLRKNLVEMTGRLEAMNSEIDTIVASQQRLDGQRLSQLERMIEGNKMRAAGLTAKEDMVLLKRNLVAQLGELPPDEMAQKIATLQNMAATLPNPDRATQFHEYVRAVTDDRGLVSSWALLSGIDGDLVIATGEGTREGQAVRQNLNEALGRMTTAEDQVEIDEAIEAFQLSVHADKYLANGQTLAGQRLLNRARRMLDYRSGNARVNSYRRLALSEAARSEFGLSLSADSYRNYEVVNAANILSGLSGHAGAPAYEVGLISLRSAESLRERGNLEAFDRALANIDVAVDFMRGVGEGVVNGAVDLFDGATTFISQPLATMEGLALAVANYERTYELIAEKLEEFVDRLPDMAPEEYGNLTGRVAFEVASTLLPVGGAGAKVAKYVTTQVHDVALGLRGIRALQGVAPELIGAKALTTSNLQIGRQFAALSREGQFSERALIEGLASARKYRVLTVPGARDYLRAHAVISALPDGFTVKRIREGVGNGKIAIIGRPMEPFEKNSLSVLSFKKEANLRGLEIETFEPTAAAKQELDRLKKLSSNGHVMASEVVKTKMYAENRAWALKLRNESYTVLDIGDNNWGTYFSAFYGIEKKVLFWQD